MNRFHVNELCEAIAESYQVQGTRDIFVDNIATPYQANEHSLIFIAANRADKQQLFESTRARVIICDTGVKYTDTLQKCLLITENPKYLFAKLANKFFMPRLQYGIHPTAIIHPEAIINKDVHIGPNSYIGKCEIRAGVNIHGNAYLYDNVIVEEFVTIKAGCVIGASGCGQIAGKSGVYEPFPHIGRVIIGEGSEIGTNASIAKGALSDTMIGKHAVIDSFVQIGHNVVLEENVMILANAVIGGSSVIKKQAVIAIGAHVCDYVTIGEGAHIGPGTVIMQSVPDFSKVVARAPLTMPKNEWNN